MSIKHLGNLVYNAQMLVSNYFIEEGDLYFKYACGLELG